MLENFRPAHFVHIAEAYDLSDGDIEIFTVTIDEVQDGDVVLYKGQLSEVDAVKSDVVNVYTFDGRDEEFVISSSSKFEVARFIEGAF